MTLHLLCSSSSPYLFHLSKLPPKTYSHFLLPSHPPSFKTTPPPPFISRVSSSSSSSSSETDNGVVHNSNSDAADVVSLLHDESLLNRVSAAKDADEALDIVAEVASTSSGTVSVPDCCSIIAAAIDRSNAHLALSVFYAMRSSFDQGVGDIERWKWSRPNVSVYTILVLRLAASLKVSDALKTIDYICRVGVSPSEEVPFGKVVRCPACMVAVAVAQPQHGIQISSCAKCRYKYELVSGDIVSINSEAIRNSSCRTQHGSSSLGKSAKISANNEAEHSCSCSFYCGTNPFWCSTNSQICY